MHHLHARIQIVLEGSGGRFREVDRVLYGLLLGGEAVKLVVDEGCVLFGSDRLGRNSTAPEQSSEAHAQDHDRHARQDLLSIISKKLASNAGNKRDGHPPPAYSADSLRTINLSTDFGDLSGNVVCEYYSKISARF